MKDKITSKWWFWVLVVLGVIGGLIFLAGFAFTGLFGVCSPFEPVTGTTSSIIDNINTRFGRVSSADFQAEASGIGNCQKEIIESVNADAVGVVNNVQIYFDDVEFKYYWCDADNKVVLSSSKMSDVENYFNSLYTCINEEITSLFNFE